jgi:stage II sporulation protein AA (anti-sigma F factor antagonist)
MTGEPDSLTVDVERQDGVVVLTVRGALDYFNAGALREPLDLAVADGVARVILDLTEVAFVDSSGVAMLIVADQTTRAAGGWLRLANPTPQLRRMLETTNLDRRFGLYDSLAAASHPE